MEHMHAGSGTNGTITQRAEAGTQLLPCCHGTLPRQSGAWERALYGSLAGRTTMDQIPGPGMRLALAACHWASGPTAITIRPFIRLKQMVARPPAMCH